MQPHPDFANSNVPAQADLPGFSLTPLSPNEVVEDYEAVMASCSVLQGLFGDDWPAGLTLEENAIDLAWHLREFTARRSFAWILRDPDGLYIGCVYVYPDIGTTGSAEIVTWIVDRPDRTALSAQVTPVLKDWFADVLPPGLVLRWTQSPGA